MLNLPNSKEILKSRTFTFALLSNIEDLNNNHPNEFLEKIKKEIFNFIDHLTITVKEEDPEHQ